MTPGEPRRYFILGEGCRARAARVLSGGRHCSTGTAICAELASYRGTRKSCIDKKELRCELTRDVRTRRRCLQTRAATVLPHPDS